MAGAGKSRMDLFSFLQVRAAPARTAWTRHDLLRFAGSPNLRALLRGLYLTAGLDAGYDCTGFFFERKNDSVSFAGPLPANVVEAEHIQA